MLLHGTDYALVSLSHNEIKQIITGLSAFDSPTMTCLMEQFEKIEEQLSKQKRNISNNPE